VSKGVVTTDSVAACRPLLVRKMTGLHSVRTYVHDVTLEHLCGGSAVAAGRGLLQRTIPSVVDAQIGPNRDRVGAPLAEGMSRGRPVIGAQIGGHTDEAQRDPGAQDDVMRWMRSSSSKRCGR